MGKSWVNNDLTAKRCRLLITKQIRYAKIYTQIDRKTAPFFYLKIIVQKLQKLRFRPNFNANFAHYFK